MEGARAEAETVQEPLDIIEAELAGCLLLQVEDSETYRLVMSIQIATKSHIVSISAWMTVFKPVDLETLHSVLQRQRS